jgi:hypothetical protein
MSQVTAAINPQRSLYQNEPIKLPKAFKAISEQYSTARPFISYLENRGFEREKILKFSLWFGLRYCTTGPYRYRIIFPIKYEGKIMTWTGRATFDTPLRYRTLSADPEKAAAERLPPAVAPITEYLLWYDKITHPDADTICLCEGPFDALKVAVLGHGDGIKATCFFTSEPSRQQVNLLHEVLPRYKNKYLLLDRETLPASLKIASTLSNLGVKIITLPQRLKDPGEIRSRDELVKILFARSRESAYV